MGGNELLKIWWMLVFLGLISRTLGQVTERSSDTGPEGTEDYEDEYSEPGAATENCICVPFYQCEDGEIVTDGSNLIDPRKKTQNEELPLDEKYVPPACGPYHVCCRDPSAVTVLPYEHKCGTRNPSGINGRILNADGKNEAQFGEWPWQAAILKREGREYVFKCGGTLIDDQHILTVAHCVDEFLTRPQLFVVRLGEWDTQRKDEFLPHEDFNVSEVILHEDYRKKNLFNDIAVVKLARTVHFKPHIDTACLPKPEDDFIGHECVVTGWGTNAYKTGEYSIVMKEVAMPVISHADCQNMLRKTRLGRFFKLHSGFMCAGGEEGKDSCKGDGGGPLSCARQDHSYVVTGLVSWGIECGHKSVPGVYINVKNYVNWIVSKTGKPLSYYFS